MNSAIIGIIGGYSCISVLIFDNRIVQDVIIIELTFVRFLWVLKYNYNLLMSAKLLIGLIPVIN